MQHSSLALANRHDDHSSNPHTWEAEAGGLLPVPNHFGLHHRPQASQGSSTVRLLLFYTIAHHTSPELLASLVAGKYLSMDLFACRRCTACVVGVDVCGGCPLEHSGGFTTVISRGGQGLQTQLFSEFQVPAWKFLFCA